VNLRGSTIAVEFTRRSIADRQVWNVSLLGGLFRRGIAAGCEEAADFID